MNPLPLFLIQFVWFLVVWGTIAHVFVRPMLQGVSPHRALSVWLAPQLFRVLGVGLLVPALAPQMPPSFAVTTAVGDGVTGVLALAALVALERKWAKARGLVWVCNVVGSCDLVVAMTQAAQIEAARYLAGQWYVPALMVPLMIVSHVMVFRTLLARGRQAPGAPPN
jgi:hypothetical protein